MAGPFRQYMPSGVDTRQDGAGHWIGACQNGCPHLYWQCVHVRRASLTNDVCRAPSYWACADQQIARRSHHVQNDWLARIEPYIGRYEVLSHRALCECIFLAAYHRGQEALFFFYLLQHTQMCHRSACIVKRRCHKGAPVCDFLSICLLTTTIWYDPPSAVCPKSIVCSFLYCIPARLPSSLASILCVDSSSQGHPLALAHSITFQ